MNTRPFRTRLPVRHEMHPNAAASSELGRLGSFKTTVAVRPARLVFQGVPRPRTDDLVWKIWQQYASANDRKAHKAIHTPFVYRGQVDGHAEEGEDVRVRLSEEPSGRPLVAELPWRWFETANLLPYKGLPFRLVTWMVKGDTDTLEARYWMESLLATPVPTEAP